MLTVPTGARNCFHHCILDPLQFWNDVPGRDAIKELQNFNMLITKVCKTVSHRKSKISQAGFNPFHTSMIILKIKKGCNSFNKFLKRCVTSET